MSVRQIKTLAASGESQTLELKSTTKARREGVKTVCAMLNQEGGHVLFGVNPKGRVIGQQVSERTIEEVSAELRRIDPPAFPSVERVPVITDREVVMVRVSPGAAKPYRYNGEAYRRLGNTTVPMSADEYNRMLFERMYSEQRWENQPAVGWSVEDLDAAEIRRTVEEAIRQGRQDDPGTREPADLLRGLGLLADGELLRAAIILFGSAERIEFAMPQCLLRVARFDGLDRSEFLDNRQFRGHSFTLLKAAERFLRENNPIASRFEADRFDRIDEPLYPPLAVREALANALCHRDYSLGGGSVGLAIYDDRLEVTSSGTLHFGLTPEMLFAPHESLPWNPLIANVFYRRGIIEVWGRGILKMAAETTATGMPPPEIEESGGCVTVRFRHGRPTVRLTAHLRGSGLGSSSLEVDNLTENQQAIVALLSQGNQALALREIRARLGPETAERRVRKDLRTLKARGLITSTGHGRGARWKQL